MMTETQTGPQEASQQALLTIAIPTFNRNEILKQLLEKLLPQLTPEVPLLIIDNASDVPVLPTISGLLEEFPAASIRVVRNRWNIGGDANMLRCFELCETEYLWVLGDDDEPLPDAVETVLGTIRDHSGALFYNFACELYSRSKESTSHTLDDFIASIDSFSNVLFVSTSVFRARELSAYLAYGNRFMYSMVPHLVLLIHALHTRRGRCLLLKAQIVRLIPTPEGTRWSYVAFLLGLGILLDLPLTPASRKRLARILPRPRALELVTAQVMGLCTTSANSQSARFIMDQIYRRLLKYSGGWTTRIRFLLYRYCLLHFPSLTLALLRQIVARTGRGGALVQLRDPFK